MEQSEIFAAFRTFIPVNGMKPSSQKDVFAKVQTRELESGSTLFKHGDSEPTSIYLVSGKVELVSPDGETLRSLTAGTKEATYRIAHQFPRTCSAKVVEDAYIVQFPNDLLDVALTWDQTGRFEVGELAEPADGGADDSDWMTRVLQMPIFQRIPPSNLQALFMKMEAMEAKVGDVVVRQGDEGDYFYVINSGRCIVTRESPSHDKPVKLAELGPGSCFGEEALISDDKRNATVTVMQAGSMTRLAKQSFQDLLQGSVTPQLSMDDAEAKAADGSAKLLDVRLPSEVAQYKLDGAINLPLYMLRMKLAGLPKDQSYIICCDTGRRSAVAAFIMTQRGYNVTVVSGGINGSSAA